MFKRTGGTKHCKLKQTKDWCEMALANTSQGAGNGRGGQEKAGAVGAGNYAPCIRRERLQSCYQLGASKDCFTPRCAWFAPQGVYKNCDPHETQISESPASSEELESAGQDVPWQGHRSGLTGPPWPIPGTVSAESPTSFVSPRLAPSQPCPAGHLTAAPPGDERSSSLDRHARQPRFLSSLYSQTYSSINCFCRRTLINHQAQPQYHSVYRDQSNTDSRAAVGSD